VLGLHLSARFKGFIYDAGARLMSFACTDRQTDASDLIICPMLCYSNGTDKNIAETVEVSLRSVVASGVVVATVVVGSVTHTVN